MRLRLVTINTAKEEAPYHRRLELLAAGLAALEPDIVLLQETFNSPDHRFNTTRALAAALGLIAIEAPARCKPRRIEGEIIDASAGLGLLSRFPVTAQDRMPLPADPRDGERIAQLARISTPRGELLIVNTHLTHLRGGAQLRQRQLTAIFDHPWLANAGEVVATVLGGDLNTDLPRLPDLLATVPPGWSLLDTYQAAGGAKPRVTMPAYWAWSEDRCLDYVISITRAGEPHPRWTEAAIVLTEPDGDGIFPSDHRGVAVALELDDPPRASQVRPGRGVRRDDGYD